ncbi:hypothetical protein [Lacinutrix chionoecetis]
MQNILTIFLILLLSQSALGQKQKNVIYIDSNNEIITLNEFQSIDKRKIYTSEVKNDTAVITTVHLRKNIGKLDSLEHQQVRMLLSKIIGTEIDENKNIMIHLYSKKDKQIIKDKKYKKYWKWINNNSGLYQSFLIGTKNSGITTNRKKQIFVDDYNLLKKLFFSSSNFEINHLFIKPNGEIYIYYGGEDILDILDWSV